MQLFWYKGLLQKDADLLMRSEAGASGTFKKLRTLWMQLRKCCNHPFLFPSTDDTYNLDTLVEASGKMQACREAGVCLLSSSSTP